MYLIKTKPLKTSSKNQYSIFPKRKTSNHSISQTVKKIKQEKLKSVDVVLNALDVIDHENGWVNAFVFVQDRAKLVDIASHIDEKSSTDEGLLCGVPIAVKDNFNVLDYPTTCASRILENFVSPYDATVCSNIKKAGGVIIGKTNLDEFAMGSLSKNSIFGPSINPRFTTDHRCTGGSSGGSAAAVASNMVYAALGTDTGGSTRLPAAWCSIVGFKPSYGMCSRHGLIAYASSLDCPSIFTRYVADAALMLDVVGGYCENDSTSYSGPRIEDNLKILLERTDLNGVVVGIPHEFHVEELKEDILDAWDGAIKLLQEKGASVKFINLPHTEYALSTYYIIACAEASSNLARYDGLRYGTRSEKGDSVKDLYINTRDEGFGEEVKKRILLGTYVLQESAYNDYYRKAIKVRNLIKDDYLKAFKEVDIILTPTSNRSEPPLISEDIPPLENYSNDVMTVSPSLAGLPAISVPSTKGSTIGIQLIAPYMQDAKLLSIAKFLEQQ